MNLSIVQQICYYVRLCNQSKSTASILHSNTLNLNPQQIALGIYVGLITLEIKYFRVINGNSQHFLCQFKLLPMLTYLYICIVRDLVCRRRYKGHQNQLKYLKFPSSLSPPLQLTVFRYRYRSSLSTPVCSTENRYENLLIQIFAISP